MSILSIVEPWRLEMQVVAKYNMNLDNGTFIQGRVYQCFKKSENPLSYWVTTEEGTQQKLMDLDFIALFNYLTL